LTQILDLSNLRFSSKKSTRRRRFRELNSSLGIRASPVSAAGFPHNSDMALYSELRVQPVQESIQEMAKSTGRLNRPSVHAVGPVVQTCPLLISRGQREAPPIIRTVTAYQVSGLPLCSPCLTPLGSRDGDRDTDLFRVPPSESAAGASTGV
jgi:hypothetical protein